jgi:hypothetical protein
MSACPRRSCTNLGFTPCLSRSVAHVCLRSWKRVFSGGSACSRRALKAQFRLPYGGGEDEALLLLEVAPLYPLL